ncbi:NUDIX domain-containing protein [Amycolatopsis sp. NBC_01307]|uniref:NUDIX hydrolase n=1 Tax=Amycolatopsis sp. NBC_01307 TaxID=2903561 RepID=UPI002E11CE28|nr:NUDIX domain-containing protein [Amycolatopsis sp. NBC_01307]
MPLASEPTVRVGARVLLLNSADEVLLIHARDPDAAEHHWWELPGGGQEPGEKLEDTARREIAEETGLILDEIGRKLWTRESRFTYRGREHHRLDHVYLARTDDTEPRAALRHTANERAGLIEHRWWPVEQLQLCRDKLLPDVLPNLLSRVLTNQFPDDVIAISASVEPTCAGVAALAAEPADPCTRSSPAVQPASPAR